MRNRQLILIISFAFYNHATIQLTFDDGALDEVFERSIPEVCQFSLGRPAHLVVWSGFHRCVLRCLRSLSTTGGFNK